MNGEEKQIYEITVGDKKCKLSAPNRHTMKIVLSKVLGSNPEYIDAGQIVLNTCWIEGDPELKDTVSDQNASYNISACMQAWQIVELRQSDLKKL